MLYYCLVMSLLDLRGHEREIVFECLGAAVDGPFFPDDDFHTIFGLEREDVAEIVKSWPDVDDSDEDVSTAINNAMNNLLGYPHGREDAWDDFISVSPEEVFCKWRGEAIEGCLWGLA